MNPVEQIEYLEERVAQLESALIAFMNDPMLNARLSAIESRIAALDQRVVPVVERSFEVRPGNKALAKQLKDLTSRR